VQLSTSSAVNGFELEYRKLPPLGWEEKVIMLDFCTIAALWFFRDPKGATDLPTRYT
jgi:di/tricarboxylate transporter